MSVIPVSDVVLLLSDALEERIAKHAIWLCRSVEVTDAGIEGLGLDETSEIAGSRMPSIIAVKVFLVKPSTRSGRLESTYTIRGETWTGSKPASTSRG